jgi:Skp family chaperone for outer membrane proteins
MSRVSNIFKLPYIQIDKLVEEVKLREDEIGEEVNEYLSSEKERLVNEARAELEKLKAKKKKGIPDDINEDDYVP